ncbi:MAG: Asp-tRNA(Asn)/Glu-tRNA(Gln) amidotransferase GatCAB subunit B, partial [Chloroflexi bacterium]|nr:Asp-tRNA(Asn)/Glu-tRNA(Gln) amidotransferase GatCAB subunit B [Chloroflexota bacterium]
VRPVGSETFGTKVEVKNLNSFRSVRLAIAYEVERQARLLEQGERVEQVTVGWDEERRRTVFQRSKEYAEDYRYFPEPDLPPLEFTPKQVESLAASLPELPDAKASRFVSQYGLRAEDARLLAEDHAVADYFEAVVAPGATMIEPRQAANWITGEIFRLLRDAGREIAESSVMPAMLRELLAMLARGAINATVAKDVLNEMFASGESAEAVVARRGLTQIDDRAALREIVRNAVDANPKPLQQYLEGKTTVLGFFVGQVMRATRGQADVHVVTELLQEELGRRKTS